MLSQSSVKDGSGGRGLPITMSGFSPRWLIVSALTVPIVILIALAITTLSGPVFGVWGWAEVALAMLLIETGFLMMLGMYRGEHNPYRSIVPGASHWAMRTNDPLVLYAGTVRPPISANARVSSDARPLLLAIAPALGALMMLGVVIAGSAGAAPTEPQPASLPIVEVDGSISMMLESVEMTADRLTLAIRIDDLEWGRSTAGYLTPQPEDVTVNGRPISEAELQSAGYTTVSRTDKPGANTFPAWQLHLPLTLPADPSQPLTVTIDTLRFVPNGTIPDLPETIDGNWSFTFIPVMP